MFEVSKFRFKNANRGQDKVSLFKKAHESWTESRFLEKVHKHKIQSNESREGRKLDLAGNFRKFRIATG
jgi:hypothetical protein